jgi:dienelactone hydrolase
MKTNVSPAGASFEQLRSMFDDDYALPLKLEETGVEYKQGVAIHDVSYASLASRRIKAYWVMPDGKGPFPGVIFVHPAPGNRENFLEEAVMLAKQGMASLLIEAPWSQGEAWGRTMGEPVQRRHFSLNEVGRTDRMEWLDKQLSHT